MATKPKGAQDGQEASKTTPAAAIPFYKIQKDGNGFSRKIANMDNPKICPRRGIVEIEVLKKSNFNEPRYSITVVPDPETGILYGVPIGIDEKTGAIKWQRFIIGDFRRYDLSKASDAIEWAVVSRSPRLVGSPFAKGKPMYKKHDKEEEARTVIKNSTLRKKAMAIMEESMTPTDYPDMLRNFGKNPAGLSPTMAQAELLKVAERTPEEFVNVWENVNRNIITTFNRCKSVGLMIFDLEKGGWMWRGTIPMGMTDQAVIKYLSDNKQLLVTADHESKARDVVGKALVGDSKKQTESGGVEEEEVVDQELENLRIEARMMGIDGVGMMSKEQLRETIDLKSQEV